MQPKNEDELVDMLHKLILTSLLAFLPMHWQMPAGLVTIMLYSIFILAVRPYVRKNDDGLHLLANVEFPEEAATASTYGAEGIGLFRSEYLLGRGLNWPSEELSSRTRKK